MVFDPFGDFATRGYLRNHAGETDLDIVKQLEHRSFQAGLARTMNDMAKAEPIGYAEVLATHKTLFSGVYPWAGTDRMRNAADIVITKAGYTDLFAHPLHIPQVLGWALSKAADPDFMCERPGSVMGALAHAHPFLDGNGRTMMVVHHELAARAGIAIAWDQTNKADYLQALTEELQQPEARRLDFYLKPFIREAVERQTPPDPADSFGIWPGNRATGRAGRHARRGQADYPEDPIAFDVVWRSATRRRIALNALILWVALMQRES